MYFSDKELGIVDRTSVNISIEVWNGIVSVFEEFKSSNSFSSKFPEKCPDNGRICGFYESLFEKRVKAEIPNINTPINIDSPPIIEDITEEKINDNISSFEIMTNNNIKDINKYAILDFIQFCHKNIQEAIEDGYHSYFQHYHFKFRESKKLKKDFRDKINQIFERNRIVFFINDEGQINRVVPPTMQPLINKIYNTKDEKLNELVQLAHDKFVLPNIEDRIHALEKIWDAFERVKTFFGEKKVSAPKLVKLVAKDNIKFEKLIEEESKNILTKIGNDFQIRHFETDTIEITDNKHIDYLFYRMSSLIHLYLTELE